MLKEKGLENIRFLSSDPIRFPALPVKNRVDQNYPRKALFLKAEAEHLPIYPNSLDGVSLFFVLHHIPQSEHKAIFDQIKSSLKDNGLLFLVEDTPEGEEEKRKVANWDKRLNLETGSTGHYYRSYQKWVGFLQENGFEYLDSTQFEDKSAFKNEGVIKHSSIIFKKT